MPLKLLTHAEQVAEHLCAEIRKGRWTGTMPGAITLQQELGTNHNTVDLALRQLESEGVLASQGTGRPRRILEYSRKIQPMLKIAILLYEPNDRKVDYHLDLLRSLLEAGYSARFAKKTLTELGMDVNRVAKFVEKTETDAWVVVSGSRSVMEWFAVRDFPAFALFGRMKNLAIAGTGPNKSPALLTAVRKLASLGHRRIVMISREERRKPLPGFLERTFLKELEEQGIPTGTYNLPDWKDDTKGFHQLLDSLFRHTPPTALLMDGGPLFVAAQQALIQRGMVVPRDVSMICMEPDLAFKWCDPAISHINFESRPWMRHILRWAKNAAYGREDRRNTVTAAEFFEGGTIGPVPAGKRSGGGATSL